MSSDGVELSSISDGVELSSIWEAGSGFPFVSLAFCY